MPLIMCVTSYSVVIKLCAFFHFLISLFTVLSVKSHIIFILPKAKLQAGRKIILEQMHVYILSMYAHNIILKYTLY